MNSDELEEMKKTNLLLGNLLSEVVQIRFELVNERLWRERAQTGDLPSKFLSDLQKSVGIPVDLGTAGQYKVIVPGE